MSQMSVESVLLCFALVGSAITVVEKIAAVFAVVLAKANTNQPAAVKESSKSAQVGAKVEPALSVDDKFTRLIEASERTLLDLDAMKDANEVLTRRLEAAEQALAAGQTAVKPSRARARKSTDPVSPQQEPDGAPTPPAAAQEFAPSHAAPVGDEGRFERVH